MSTRPERGFTLVELMVAVSVIAVIAAIAVPSLLRARIGANESSAVGALRAIISAESIFHSKDSDRNTVADYWTADVSGLYRVEKLPVGSRRGVAAIDEALAKADDAKMSTWGSFGARIPGTTVSAAGLIPMTQQVARSGYRFRAMVSSSPFFGWGTGYRTDPDGNWQYWTNTSRYGIQARPERYGTTGHSTFIVNERGVIYGRDWGTNSWWLARNWPGDNPTVSGWRVVQ